MSPTLAADLAAVAFGAEPGRWPLPPATDPDQLWLRAVAAGGQGRYAIARNCTAEVIRRAPRGRLGSLALSTQASFLRQLGWHRVARGWDGRAYACAGADPEAGVDALIGLSADALGVGRLATSDALLHRAADLLAGADSPPPRLAIRLAWCARSWRWPAVTVRPRSDTREPESSWQSPPCRLCAGIGSRAMWCWPPRCAAPGTVLPPGRWPIPCWPTPKGTA